MHARYVSVSKSMEQEIPLEINDHLKIFGKMQMKLIITVLAHVFFVVHV